MIKLFVGLGNPGAQYRDTRHNAGFWFIDALAASLKVTLAMDRSFHGYSGRCNVDGQTVWLLQPQTFMNLSGKSVAALARFYKITPEEILVAHDELDIAPGEAKLKFDGSHAGHTTVCATSTPNSAARPTGVCASASDTLAPRRKWSIGSCKSRHWTTKSV